MFRMDNTGGNGFADGFKFQVFSFE
jgi:hypothetical protein